MLGIRQGGSITIFCQKFMSRSTESFRKGALLCFKKFRVSKIVRDKRGGGFHDFPSKLFCLTVPNHFVEEPFCVSKGFGYRKLLGIREEWVSRLSVKIVLSHSTESVRRWTLLSFKKFRVLKFFMPTKDGGSITISHHFFCLTVP